MLWRFFAAVAAFQCTLAQEAVSLLQVTAIKRQADTNDPDAFAEVQSKNDTAAMAVFIQKYIQDSGGRVRNDFGLQVVAPFYSGERSSRGFAYLQSELGKEEWAEFWSVPETWKDQAQQDVQKASAIRAAAAAEAERSLLLIRKGAERSLEDLPSDGTSALAPAVPVELRAHAHRQRGYHNETPLVDTGLVDVAKSQEGTALNLVPADDADAPSFDSQVSDAAALPPLTQRGYQEVAKSGNATAMTDFIRRTIVANGMSIQDENSLNGLVPYHNGQYGVQTFDRLKMALKGAEWTGYVEGKKLAPEFVALQATLDQEGYEAVAATQDTAKMAAFMRRIIQAEGGHMVDGDQKLLVSAKYFSGEKATQDFRNLEGQLRKADWVVGMPAPQTREASESPSP